MKEIGLINKVASIWGINGTNILSVSIDKQRSFLEEMQDATDCVERSYKQYQCQMFLLGNIKRTILNLASLPMIVYYWIKRNSNIEHTKADAVYVNNHIDSVNLIPDELQCKYKMIMEVDTDGVFFDEIDKRYMKRLILRFPFSWYFILKNLINLRHYSYLINKYQPYLIISLNEYSFSSSILTDYCNNKKVKHYNVMHGEKLFSIRDSWFSYNKMFVWDEYYKRLFTNLKAKEDQFVVYKNMSLCLGDGKTYPKEYDYTYYLQNEKKEEFEAIKTILEAIKLKGYRVSIRPHPIYTEASIKEVFFHAFDIETNLISIKHSILRTKNVISKYSTVLSQAYYSNVDIVIDNITNPSQFHIIQNSGYIMLQKEHKLLSDVIDSLEDKKC